MKNKAHKSIVMLGTSPEAHGGIATVVGNYRDSGALKEWNVRYLITHVEGSRFRKANAVVAAMFRLLSMLVAGEIGLLHVHMSSNASTWRKALFIMMGMAFRIPYLIHLHSPDFIHFFEHGCGKHRKNLIRFMLSRATRVIALSSSWAKDIKKIAPATRTKILFNSVPLPKIELCVGEESAGNDQGDPPLILFLGQIGTRKGVFDLIHAASTLDGDFRLIIGGDGELQQARALAENLGLIEKIEFTGWLGKAEKEYLLARAAIFVLPSYNEGMPMAILEAMSWAVPIVTTPVGGIPEVIMEGQEGLLVDSGDIPGLAHALTRLLTAPSLCRKLGKAGRRKIELEYSMEVLRPQLEQLWISSGIAEPESVALRRKTCF